ncbi:MULTISPECIES: hypothetical protein [unclassified Rhodanobacter]|uniref:hypothetical protein n=1 Tax=unclassified Rhodanobacter TaxID=2621553 RepID=UPI001BE0A014|nr:MULTISPECIES: hypothetical protein [unclassified Rhodanobacter]MBT2144574.1 hypothetical protein [Rhodanobacter sp. LX-99]MBT2148619.1 hypothetical protein [Rhodanobacter sp. LX-100]
MSPPGTAGDVSPYEVKDNYATLVYSIEITGHTHKENAKAGTYADATVHQRLDGSFHLKGEQGYGSSVDNAQEIIKQGEPLRQAMMPAIQQAMATCGDDEDCMTAAMMKAGASMSPAQREMARTAKDRMAPKLTRHDLGHWALDPMKPRCSLHAVTQGSSRYRSLDVGEGYSDYVTGSEQRRGQGHDDCTTGSIDDLPNVRAEWNGDTRILKLDLPGLSVDEQAKDADGKASTKQVTIRDIELDELHWSGKGPQSGQRTRKVTAGGIPATMTIRWTFTPDKA